MQTAESQPNMVLTDVITMPPRTASGYVGKTVCGSQDRDAAEVESSYALTYIHKICLDQHPSSLRKNHNTWDKTALSTPPLV